MLSGPLGAGKTIFVKGICAVTVCVGLLPLGWARRGAAVTDFDDGDWLREAIESGQFRRHGGGFGILLTSHLVDELAFNERHNELMFVKYLS